MDQTAGGSSLQRASLFEQCISKYQGPPVNMEFDKKSFNEAFALVTTVDECIRVFECFRTGAICNKVFTKALELSNSFDDCVKIYKSAPFNSRLAKGALNKAFKYASTSDEFLRIYKDAPIKSRHGEKAIRKSLKLAKSYSEFMAIYQFSPVGSRIEILAKKEIEKLTNA